MLNENNENKVNKEEIKLNISIEEYDNLIYIVKEVLHMIEIENYERYRTVFMNEEVEIALDEYPFGVALEIETQKNVFNPEKIIDKYINLLNLNYKDSYKLSWDDKYEELYNVLGIEKFSHVTFDKIMPEIRNK